MSRTFPTILRVVALVVVPYVCGAQSRGAARQPAGSKVPVRVFVSLSDSTTRFYPVRGHRLVFYRSANDTVVVVTDSLGSATVALSAGDYRLVSAENVAWHGYEYSWSVPISVHPGMAIIDLRAPDAEAPTGNSSSVTSPAATTMSVSPAGTSSEAVVSARSGSAQLRNGFWFSVGLGGGDCGQRTNGLSGGLGLGGTISQHVLLGAFTSGWYKEENGASVNASVLVAGIRYYPSVTNGFFMLAGLGVGALAASADGIGSASETGSGAILGLGWDIRIAPNVSLTPFWNGIGISVSDGDANYGQIGLGFTIH
jgi:hypothetical protein